jgi:uncharacterized protein YneF (UPF0154 family)
MKDFMSTPLGAVVVFLAFIGGGMYLAKKMG